MLPFLVGSTNLRSESHSTDLARGGGAARESITLSCRLKALGIPVSGSGSNPGDSYSRVDFNNSAADRLKAIERFLCYGALAIPVA